MHSIDIVSLGFWNARWSIGLRWYDDGPVYGHRNLGTGRHAFDCGRLSLILEDYGRRYGENVANHRRY